MDRALLCGRSGCRFDSRQVQFGEVPAQCGQIEINVVKSKYCPPLVPLGKWYSNDNRTGNKLN